MGEELILQKNDEGQTLLHLSVISGSERARTLQLEYLFEKIKDEPKKLGSYINLFKQLVFEVDGNNETALDYAVGDKLIALCSAGTFDSAVTNSLKPFTYVIDEKMETVSEYEGIVPKQLYNVVDFLCLEASGTNTMERLLETTYDLMPLRKSEDSVNYFLKVLTHADSDDFEEIDIAYYKFHHNIISEFFLNQDNEKAKLKKHDFVLRMIEWIVSF